MQNEPPALEYDQLPPGRSVGESIAALALDPAYSVPDFTGILYQLKGDNIEALATETRYNLEVEKALIGEYPPSASRIRPIPCKVDPKPARGSYNLVFFLDFEDGKSWVLKIPVNGHPRCWDEFAAGALASEAFTMRWIREKTTIPVPEVYRFDTSRDNAIGCPYIMMEYIKGQSLYQGWFNPAVSPAGLEQFRARALQTIAAAMVQLHNFRFHTSGSLRFGVDGKPYGFQSAKVVDFLGTAARAQDDPSMDALFAKKGPFENSMDFLLFNLNRRESMYSENAHMRGIYESLRLFTQWTLEPVSGDRFPFVLGHSDFDLQNILVKEDGTLCGILDWDGVSAVPHTVGCLRYPLWLTRDWEPSNYNYDAATGGRKVKAERWENSPEENECYRAMYAQFIETELSHQKMDGRFAKITRLSLLAGVLESADTVPEFLYETIQNLYGKIGEDVGEEPYELDGGFATSEKVGDSKEEEEKKWQEASELQAEDGAESPAHVNDSEEEKEAKEWPETAEMQGEDITEPTELESPIASQGEEVPRQVDCKKCEAAQMLESSKTENGTHMLNTNCNLPESAGVPQHTSVRADTVPILEEGDDEGETSERTVQGSDTLKGRGSKLLSWTAHKLREAAEVFYVNPGGHAKIEDWRRERSPSDLARARAMDDAKAELPSMTTESELEHSKDCPRNKKPIRPFILGHEDHSAIARPGDVWARIGRMVQNRGVPTTMIEDHEADIAEVIVQMMKAGQNRAGKSRKTDGLRAMNVVSEMARYTGIIVAKPAGQSAGNHSNETMAKLKEILGAGPSLAEAHSVREYKHVDTELARLDPAIIAAKKSNDQKPGVHEMNSNTLCVGAETPGKVTASDKSKLLAVAERYDGIRSRVAEIPDMEALSAKAQHIGAAHSKGLPRKGQEHATKYIQTEGGHVFPYDKSISDQVEGNRQKRCHEGNRPKKTSIFLAGTQGSSARSRLRSSGPLKDGHGDETLLSEDISHGGVLLGTKQAFSGNIIMDDFQKMNQNVPSREEIGYDNERSFTTNDHDANSSNEEYVFIDNGGFNMNDICIGLGEDTLSEERFGRLRMGFMQVLESTLGLV